MSTIRPARPLDGDGFALLRLESTRLLVPQQDIRVLDLTTDVDRTAPPPAGAGWIAFRHQRIPVYCLSPRLTWQGAVGADRVICAVLEGEGTFFGLLCSEVILLKAHEFVIHAIPPAVRVPDAPFDRLALYGDKLACVSSAARLLAHLPALAERAGQPLQEAL